MGTTAWAVKLRICTPEAEAASLQQAHEFVHFFFFRNDRFQRVQLLFQRGHLHFEFRIAPLVDLQFRHLAVQVGILGVIGVQGIPHGRHGGHGQIFTRSENDQREREEDQRLEIPRIFAERNRHRSP